ISVIEQNRISKIIMKGQKKLKEKDLFEKMTINEGDYASLSNFHKMKNELIAHYNNEGYLNAEVSVESEEIDNNRVNVLIKIVENQKIFIKHIEIYGNLKITDNKIKGKMTTKEKAFLKDGLFKEDDFKEDKKIILSLIKENGFPDAVIDSVIKEFSYDNKSMFINIYVTQGTEYKIGEITINGNTEVKTEILQRYVKARRGDVFNQSVFDNMLAGMYEYYMNKGYIYVSIIPEDIREDEYISFNLNITENSQAIIRDIIIAGNEKTEDAIVRREILTLPGDVFKRNELVLSHSNLFRSGYYEDVQINPIPIPESDKVDIEFRVVEKTTGEFNIGMQYNQVDNFSGNIKIGINNILGKGLSSNLMLEKGFNVFNINMGFTEPYLMGYPVVAGADGYYQTRDYTYYNDRRTGGKIRTGYLLSKKLNTK
ncbi:outer membrane protein assembly factor BamA, partial [candidate division WOR-3 bacterium]|nr:outer membrane protein assembly factor BamA [candidate division WOR-3 bacterium]